MSPEDAPEFRTDNLEFSNFKKMRVLRLHDCLLTKNTSSKYSCARRHVSMTKCFVVKGKMKRKQIFLLRRIFEMHPEKFLQKMKLFDKVSQFP